MRIISDVHGKHNEYLDIISDCDYSVQLGDFGFNYKVLNKVDYNYHKIIPGNHDNYDDIFSGKYLHFLYDFDSFFLGHHDFFYCRGAVSIDAPYLVHQYLLTGEKRWWEEEQLTKGSLLRAIKSYKNTKPKIVLTHDCPARVVDYVSSPRTMKMMGFPIDHRNDTQRAFDQMLDIHEPDFWFFGHFHVNRTLKIGKTTFVCMRELEYFDLEI